MRWARKLWLNDRAAVAPTVALSLFALIGAGGLAFDYAHMAALDTELQNAADQAALAAATQLDGSSGAQARATAAAQSLLRNTTLFADATNAPAGDSRKITVPTIAFYKSYDETSDAPGPLATGGTADEESHVVIVTVGARRAAFAFTPILGVLNSGDLSASAVASLSSSICQVPPLMFCAPSADFPTVNDVGKGVLLEPGPKVGSWAPGNYGYLDFGNGASGVKTNLGKNNDGQACIDGSSGIPTEPGNQTSVTSALNSRFDLYAGSLTNCDSASGDFCPASNVRKDLAITEETDVVGAAAPAAPPANPGCGAAGAKAIDTSNTTDSNGFTLSTPPRGLPRDTCQINGTSCGQPSLKFGDGAWDRNTYVTANFGTTTTASAIATAAGTTAALLTRWQVYTWELADKAARLAKKATNLTPSPIPYKKIGNTGTGNYTFTNRCEYPQPKTGTGVAATSTQKDRRLLTVAVVDCAGASGKFDAHVLRFADMFLVEPSLDRSTPDSPYATGKEQIYAEIVGVAKRPNGNSSFQYYLRQRARLLK